MNEFIKLPEKERAAVFEETAARLGIGRAAIVEKDFWVCWTLAQLFGPDGPADVAHATPALLFKGGTSLSKVFGLIDRFSEDIDLVVDRTLLVGIGERPDELGIAVRERDRRIDNICAACTTYVRECIAPFLASRTNGAKYGTVAPDLTDEQTLRFNYARVLPASAYGGSAYVNASIRLEFGARGELWPAITGTVASYASTEFPQLFRAPAARVRALSPQRTFWEKATILHDIASNGKERVKAGYSRHYSDLARIAKSALGLGAMNDTQLLLDVARHKAVYFAKPAAKYELARPGTLRLVPTLALQKELTKDYASMREMFIADPPAFAEIMTEIGDIEARINASAERHR